MIELILNLIWIDTVVSFLHDLFDKAESILANDVVEDPDQLRAWGFDPAIATYKQLLTIVWGSNKLVMSPRTGVSIGRGHIRHPGMTDVLSRKTNLREGDVVSAERKKYAHIYEGILSVRDVESAGEFIAASKETLGPDRAPTDEDYELVKQLHPELAKAHCDALLMSPYSKEIITRLTRKLQELQKDLFIAEQAYWVSICAYCSQVTELKNEIDPVNNIEGWKKSIGHLSKIVVDIIDYGVNVEKNYQYVEQFMKFLAKRLANMEEKVKILASERTVASVAVAAEAVSAVGGSGRAAGAESLSVSEMAIATFSQFWNTGTEVAGRVLPTFVTSAASTTLSVAKDAAGFIFSGTVPSAELGSQILSLNDQYTLSLTNWRMAQEEVDSCRKEAVNHMIVSLSDTADKAEAQRQLMSKISSMHTKSVEERTFNEKCVQHFNELKKLTLSELEKLEASMRSRAEVAIPKFFFINYHAMTIKDSSIDYHLVILSAIAALKSAIIEKIKNIRAAEVVSTDLLEEWGKTFDNHWFNKEMSYAQLLEVAWMDSNISADINMPKIETEGTEGVVAEAKLAAKIRNSLESSLSAKKSKSYGQIYNTIGTIRTAEVILDRFTTSSKISEELKPMVDQLFKQYARVTDHCLDLTESPYAADFMHLFTYRLQALQGDLFAQEMSYWCLLCQACNKIGELRAKVEVSSGGSTDAATDDVISAGIAELNEISKSIIESAGAVNSFYSVVSQYRDFLATRFAKMQKQATDLFKTSSQFKAIVTLLLERFEKHVDVEFAKALQSSRDDFYRSSSIAGQLRTQAAFYGVDVQDVPGDGNCFFHAIADQLVRQGYSSLPHEELRIHAASFMVEHQSEYREILDALEGGSETYMHSMFSDGIWADEPIINALARALNLTIVVVRSDGAAPNVINAGCEKKLFVGYHVGLHYVSLRGVPNANMAPHIGVTAGAGGAAGALSIVIGGMGATESKEDSALAPIP